MAESIRPIDELDRLEDDEALSLLADTIKTLSDHAVPVTLVLVGVADSVDELLGDHCSSYDERGHDCAPTAP